MIFKYKVPKHELKRYNKKILYCRILEQIKVYSIQKKYIYKVRLINLNNKIDIFNSDELKKLNIIDKIKILKYKK